MTRAELPLAISWRMVACRRKGIFFIPKLPLPIRPTTIARRRKGIFFIPPFFKAQPHTVPTIVTKAHASHWVFPFKFDFNSYLRFCYKKNSTLKYVLFVFVSSEKPVENMFFMSLCPLKTKQKICSLCLYVPWKTSRKYILFVFMSSNIRLSVVASCPLKDIAHLFNFLIFHPFTFKHLPLTP